MRVNTEDLTTFLLDSGLVSKKDLSEAEKEAEKNDSTVDEVLINKGLVQEDEMRRVQAHILGIPYVSLKGKKTPIEILSLIPEPIARNHNVIAFEKSDKGLEVAMLDINDLPAIDFIKKKVGTNILPRLTDADSIKEALLQYQRSLKEEFGEIIKRETENLTIKSQKEGEEQNLEKLAEDLPVVRMVDTLIKHAITQDASDIHVEPMEDQVLIRYRIDGILHDAMKLPKEVGPGISARIKVLAGLKLDEKRLPQDGRFKVEMEGEKVSFRVSVLPTYYGEKTVMRLLKDSAVGFTLEGLGFHGENLERIHWATTQTTGMILTTGPTGSGKTTTLYTVLDILNTPKVNISTVEDPIEYQMARINQTQVKPDIGFTFSKGLRSLVRQDPDIIMVGEIRDNETASLAVNAALTGHLVLSTLHTNSAAGAIPRLIDIDAEPFLLVSTLKVIIGQRLVRRLTREKEEFTLSEKEVEKLRENVDLDRVMERLVEENILEKETEWSKVPFYRPKDGNEEKGFSGRIGMHEVLKVSSTIKELIVTDGTIEKIEDQAKKEGMVTMIEDGIFKAVQGITTIEEVLRVISE